MRSIGPGWTWRKLRLAGFSPSKRTLEPDDVDQVVSEFRGFLVDALQAGIDELCVVALEESPAFKTPPLPASGRAVALPLDKLSQLNLVIARRAFCAEAIPTDRPCNSPAPQRAPVDSALRRWYTRLAWDRSQEAERRI